VRESDVEEGEETWLREALSLVLADALERRWAPMPQTQKATLVSRLEARRILGESTSIKLPPVTVGVPRDLKAWSTTVTETE